MASGDARQRLGRRGEQAAETVLADAGMCVVARRFRTRRGEIDLIVVDRGVVVFVEVKTRRGRGFGLGEAVTPDKQRRIAAVAAEFLARRGWSARPCRFDVVEVLERDGCPSLRHVRDAFRLWPTG